MEQAVSVQAKFYKPIYMQGDASGFQIALYRYVGKDAGKGYFKAKGKNLITDRACVLHGVWERSRGHGNALAVSYAEDIPEPEPSGDMALYLAGMRIKGLGETTAKKIVNMYGDQVLKAMESPEKLAKIPRVSLKMAKEMSEEWEKRKGLRPFQELFFELGLPAHKAVAAYNRFHGEKLGVEEIRKRPYYLCACEGLSFPEVDGAVRKAADGDLFYYDPDRIFYGIVYCILRNEKAGHVFATREALLGSATDLLFGGAEGEAWRVKYMINEMVRKGSLVFDLGVLYRKRIHQAEKGCAELIKGLLLCPKRSRADIGRELGRDNTLSGRQRDAIRGAFSQNVSIITGGPGTGKTYCLRRILQIYKGLCPGKDILLCAPTGRAAQKMAENAGHPASTIHHALRLTEDGSFAAGKPEPLDVGMVIVDEFSMAGIELTYSLLRCIRPGIPLVLIGDKDQLPSVPCGNVLEDLIQSGKIPVTVLDRIFRQEEGSSIIENSIRVNENRLPLLLDGDTRLREVYEEDECAAAVLEEAREAAELAGAGHVQVLSPYRKESQVGARNLNVLLQGLFNPEEPGKPQIKAGSRIFRLGDRVMQLKNITDGDVYLSNGDIGTIAWIGDRVLDVRFENGSTHRYESRDFDQLEHAFAMTVHKSQGSEYDVVILPFIRLFGKMRNRKILYTAISRAKRLVIAGDPESVAYAAATGGERRNSGLCYRLAKCLENWSPEAGEGKKKKKN